MKNIIGAFMISLGFMIIGVGMGLITDKEIQAKILKGLDDLAKELRHYA